MAADSEGTTTGGRVFAVIAVLAVYVVAYAAVRHHRVSISFAASRLLFNTQEEASQWAAAYSKDGRCHQPLTYDDSEALYMLFWPAIRLDALLTGREVESPFRELAYALPRRTATHNNASEATR
jgi:hypothetical protein